MSAQMREALKLADAALSGANMNMNVVRRKISEALAEQPAQGEAVAYWGAADSDGTLHLTMSADDGNCGQFSREQVNDFINEAIADGEPALRLVALYTAPPAPAVPDGVAEAARYFKAEGGHIGGLGASRAANILWDYINGVLAAAPEVPRG